MNLDGIVPWGRSFDEYVRMFALTEDDLGKSILGCGDGPSSFNSTHTRQGGTIVSCDPVYSFSAADIARRIEETRAVVLEGVRRNMEEFVWETFVSPEELARVRMSAMEGFLADFPAGMEQGRYVLAELPSLPFEDRQFDLALCSHLLFLYSEQLDADFHLDSIRELCRVAREVRIFPLLALNGRTSPHLQAVTKWMEGAGHEVAIERVFYEFQRGAHEMLRIRPSETLSP